MSSWVFDKAVSASTRSAPTDGRLYWGKNIKPTETDTHYVSYENESDRSATGPETVESCAEFARWILEHTNNLVLQNNPDPTWNALTRTRYDQGKIIRKKLVGNEITPLEMAYWTFDNTSEDNAFGAACSVAWGSTGTTDDRDNVSGVVTRLHNGRKTQCLYPRYSDKCYAIKSAKKGALKPNLCTAFNLDNALGDACRAWYDTLPEEVGPTNQTNISGSICTNTDWDLDECLCLNRNLDPGFALAKTSTLSAASDECWWLPCKNDDPAMRIVPAMARGRRGCPVTFCGNVTQVIDSISTVLARETEQNVNCVANTSNNGTTNTQSPVSKDKDILNSIQQDDDGDTSIGNAITTGGTSLVTWILVGIVIVALGVLLFFAIRSVRDTTSPVVVAVQQPQVVPAPIPAPVPVVTTS